MNPVTGLYRTLSPARRRQIPPILLLMLAGGLAELVTIGAVLPFLALIADPQRLSPGLHRLLGLLGTSPIVGAAILLIAAAVAAAAVRLLLAWSTQRLAMAIGHDLATRLFARMLRQPYAAHLNRNSSEVLSGVEKVQQVVFGILQPAMQGVAAAAIALLIIGLLFVIEPFSASLAALFAGLFYVGLAVATRRRLRVHSRIIAESGTARIKVAQEALGAIRDIILDRSQPLFEEKFSRLDAAYRRSQAVKQFIAGAPRFVVEAAGIVTLALIAVTFSFRPGGIVQAIPVLGVLALAAQRLLPLIQQAYAGLSHLGGGLQLLADVVALAEAPLAPDAPPAAGAPRPRFERELRFESVSFRFETGAFALRDVSFAIPCGTRIGIAGATGSGKSSLLDLLMGLLEPSAGEIRIDGRPLAADNRAQWQAQIAHVPQSIYLSDDTVAANIAFGVADDRIDMDRVRGAAAAAQAEAFIAELPAGYRTRIGERGVRLSGGQRQRLGIARALYRDLPVLILDEATNALDEATEAAVMRSILAAGDPRTVIGDPRTLIIVAHRVSTLESCDRIIRLRAGRLAGSAAEPAPPGREVRTASL